MMTAVNTRAAPGLVSAYWDTDDWTKRKPVLTQETDDVASLAAGFWFVKTRCLARLACTGAG